MKILLYNYVQCDEPNNPGGGVSIYLSNLLQALRAAGHDVYTMSAGDRYDAFSNRPRVKYDTAKQQMLIYNSPVLAPAIFSFYHPENYTQSEGLDDLPRMIRETIGNIDIFHFHNIEGLTKRFFYLLRQANPDAAMIYSAHNYSLICPEVKLWNRNSQSCTDFQDGLACTSCLMGNDTRRQKVLINKIKTIVKDREQGGWFKQTAYRLEQRFTKGLRRARADEDLPIPESDAHRKWSHKAPEYQSYRKENIELVNRVFDKTLAVSARTRQILIDLGAAPERTGVSYIGTRHYEKFGLSSKKAPTPQNLHIAYIGYMRRDKGFYYFLDSVERIPKEVLARVDVTIAAKFTDSSALQRVEKLKQTAHSIRLYDGYKQENIDEILAPVDLGIVPPLWEDNLPQVAIEFVCHGIPILTSRMGGAKEIADRIEFTFDVSDPDGLTKTLVGVAEGTVNMTDFWKAPLNLRSNAQHAEEMQRIYESIRASRSVTPYTQR